MGAENANREEKIYDVAIIGAGPAGLTAAMYSARAGLDAALLENLSPGGQLAQTEHLENYPGFTLSQSGYELSEIMHEQAEHFGAHTVYDEVTDVELEGPVKRLKLPSGHIDARSVIVASGARPAKLGIEREAKLTGSGVSYCATCDGNFFKGKDVCIVGGGDTAAADAIYLSRICTKIYMFVRRDVLRATAIYYDRLKKLPNVEIVWNSVVEEILEEDGAVAGVRVRDRVSGQTRTYEVELDQSGYVVADETGRTSAAGVFAAGDVRTKVLRQVSTAVADGANCAEACAEYLLQQQS